MAGCTKADKKRKSTSNQTYKNSNKKSVNAAKKLKRHLKDANKQLKVIRGTARAKRRASLQREVIV